MTEDQAGQIIGRLTAIETSIAGLQLAINELTRVLTAPANVIAEGIGRLYWLATIFVGLVLVYVIVRVVWNAVFKQILRY